MDGKTFASIIEAELLKREISKGDFYKAVGVTAAAMWGWRNGAKPKPETIASVESFFGIDLSDIEKPDETDELRDILRDRQDLRILLHSAKDVPASSVYALISQLEKLKEDTT